MPSLKRSQLITAAIFGLIFIVIYFGLDTKSNEQEALVKTREQKLELLNIDRVIASERELLPAQAAAVLEQFEAELENAADDTTRVSQLKTLASFWYQNGNALISGYYAQKIAENLNLDAEAWGICGTTFAIAAKRTEDDNKRKYALQKSRLAFENAISIDPNAVNNKINLALSFVDFPLEENPMKGVLMLIDLNKENPDNPAVLFQLGRLALGTNQLEKAVERLEKVIELDFQNKEAHCLLAETYQKLGDQNKALKELEICNS